MDGDAALQQNPQLVRASCHMWSSPHFDLCQYLEQCGYDGLVYPVVKSGHSCVHPRILCIAAAVAPGNQAVHPAPAHQRQSLPARTRPHPLSVTERQSEEASSFKLCYQSVLWCLWGKYFYKWLIILWFECHRLLVCCTVQETKHGDIWSYVTFKV